ncbi:MAG: SDR family oxidoreductase [Chloroflexi bacterium]|nr:SDR family oxidoreductase [Chloroflexota bacterium]
MPSGRLDGKVAIVTGAGRGNGSATARVLAAEGARVLVVDKDGDAAERVAREIGSGSARPFTADISRQSDNQWMAGAAVDAFGQIDILVANAGIYQTKRIEDMTEDFWDMIFAVNVKSVVWGVQACLPHMRARPTGRIAVTSSITGPKVGLPEMTHYAATKGAINGFVRSAALELAPKITINAVEPGTVLTEGVRAFMKPDEIETLATAIPLKKLADPEDIGYAMLFLVSDEAKYITGQTLVVDGGQILPESKLAVS